MARRSRGQVAQTGRERYVVRVFIGKDADGKRKYSSKTVHGTKTEANKVLTEMLQELDVGVFIPPKRQTVAEHLTGWLKTKTNLTPRTKKMYRDVADRYILPRLGGLRLDQLHPQHIRNAWTYLLEEKGLASKTVQHAHTVLHGALDQALADGDLRVNPAKGIKMFKRTRTEIKTLSREQVALFLETASQMKSGNPNAMDWLWVPLWTVSLSTGLRPSELLALSWDDVTDQGALSISKTLQDVGNKQWEIHNTTKTAASRRLVALPKTAVEALKDLRIAQARHILEKGEVYDRRGLIFAGRHGGILQMDYVRIKWKKTLKLAGLPDLRLYEARHTHATNLLSNGAHPKVVQDRLGHSSVAITLDRYSQVTPEVRQETAEEIERMLFG